MNLNHFLMEINSEIGPLLEMVDGFCRNEIAPLQSNPEEPLTVQQLQSVLDAALQAGMLDASQEGYGLWSEYAKQNAPTFTLSAIRKLANHNPSLAFYLHAAALGEAVKHLSTNLATASLTPLMIEGSIGLGRSALSRWLTLSDLPEDDQSLLQTCYGTVNRLQFAHMDHSDVLLPHFSQNTMRFTLLTKDNYFARTQSLFHGFDGIQVNQLRIKHWGAKTASVTPQVFSHLLIMQTLGFLAVSLGIVDQARKLVDDFAMLRKQGGHIIIEHDAVADLMACLIGAIDTTERELQHCSIQLIQNMSLRQCLTLKHSLMPKLSDAVNAAMQIFGGIGYMRDYGIEKLLRDQNCLRVLGGSQSELPVVVSALHQPQAAKAEPLASNHHLPGHVTQDSQLSPWVAFKKLPFLRLFSHYQPRSMWQEETRMLPRSLALYRRWVRAFAETHLLPISLTCDKAVAETHQYPPERDAILRTAGKAGLLSDLLPYPIGSAPVGRFRYSLTWQQAIRVEELARADGGLMLLLSAHNLGLAPVLFSGNLQVLRNVVIPAYQANKKGKPQIFAYAITEPAAGSDAEDGYGAQHNKPGVCATRTENGWLLNGRKVFISGGEVARWITVLAAIKQHGFESWTAFLVDAQSPGFTVVRTEKKMGMRVSGAAELEFNQCFVPDNRVLGGVGNGWGLNRATLNLSRLPVAAMSVGLAQQATESAIDFACRMSLADRPLIHYQQVQMQLADMLAETAAIRSLVWQYAKRWTPRQAQASIAKFYASDRAQVVIESAMDLMANHSLLHANRVEKNFRDNRLTRIFEGTNQINRLSVIEEQQQVFLNNIAHYGWS